MYTHLKNKLGQKFAMVNNYSFYNKTSRLCKIPLKLCGPKCSLLLKWFADGNNWKRRIKYRWSKLMNKVYQIQRISNLFLIFRFFFHFLLPHDPIFWWHSCVHSDYILSSFFLFFSPSSSVISYCIRLEQERNFLNTNLFRANTKSFT